MASSSPVSALARPTSSIGEEEGVLQRAAELVVVDEGDQRRDPPALLRHGHGAKGRHGHGHGLRVRALR
jgi:hypothetical protein